MKDFFAFLHNPVFLTRFHSIMVLVWIVLIPPTLLLWPESILWLALMSLWANIASHWAAANAAMADKHSQRGDQNEDIMRKLDEPK